MTIPSPDAPTTAGRRAVLLRDMRKMCPRSQKKVSREETRRGEILLQDMPGPWKDLPAVSLILVVYHWAIF